MSNTHKFVFPQLEKYYNTGDSKIAFITMDIDWAPDFILEFTFEWFYNNNIPFTAFSTHYSEYMGNQKNNPLIELGIHPNFSRTSNAKIHPSHKALECILDLREKFPSAVGCRSHRNISGRHITDALGVYGFKYHVNHLLWGASYIECTPLRTCDSKLNPSVIMLEAPYMWEDGTHLDFNLDLDIKMIPSLETPGLKILNIHPMLFYLNCTSNKQRRDVTNHYEDLTSALPNAFDDSINHDAGIGTFSRQLFLDMTKSGFKFHLLRDLMSEAYDLTSNLKWQMSETKLLKQDE